MVVPASDEPQVFYDESEDDESEDDSEEDPADEGGGPVDVVTADESEDDESEEEPESIDPIVLEARAKLEEAKESHEPITDPEIIKTLFGRCRG